MARLRKVGDPVILNTPKWPELHNTAGVVATVGLPGRIWVRTTRELTFSGRVVAELVAVDELRDVRSYNMTLLSAEKFKALLDHEIQPWVPKAFWINYAINKLAEQGGE